MTDRESLIRLIERIPDDDMLVVRSVVARFIPGLTIGELRAIADSGEPDAEPLSQSEEQGFAEVEEYLAGQAHGIPHNEVMRQPRKSAWH